MGRDVPIYPNRTCDECGRVTGCYDFMGDVYCPPCTDKLWREAEDLPAPSMTATTLPDALAIESARGAEHLAQIRAEGWRAGAEAMKAATLADIAARIDRGRRKYGPGDDSVLIMIAVENMVRSLDIPEAPNG